MARDLSDRKTIITKEQAICALWQGHLSYFGSPPTPLCVQILADQWGLETGWGKSMHNFNFGNVKSRDGDGYDYCYFACNELLKASYAQSLAKADPEHARIQAIRPDGLAWIWFYPPHPGCRFRAFESVEAGAADHVGLLAKHFPGALTAARSGDILQFAHALHDAGYYTADESQYAAGLVGCIRSIQALPVDYDSLPILGQYDRDVAQGVLAFSMWQAVDEAVAQAKRPKDDE